MSNWKEIRQYVDKANYRESKRREISEVRRGLGAFSDLSTHLKKLKSERRNAAFNYVIS